jgi:hypothetical protein
MNNNVYVDYDKAHSIVDASSNLHWDGWTIVEWRKDSDAFFNKHGSFRNGQWGRVIRRIGVSENGTWKVPAKYVMDK